MYSQFLFRAFLLFYFCIYWGVHTVCLCYPYSYIIQRACFYFTFSKWSAVVRHFLWKQNSLFSWIILEYVCQCVYNAYPGITFPIYAMQLLDIKTQIPLGTSDKCVILSTWLVLSTPGRVCTWFKWSRCFSAGWEEGRLSGKYYRKSSNEHLFLAVCFVGVLQ